MYRKKIKTTIEQAGLAGEFAEAASEITFQSLAPEDGTVIALCLVAQEIRNLALHIVSMKCQT